MPDSQPRRLTPQSCKTPVLEQRVFRGLVSHSSRLHGLFSLGSPGLGTTLSSDGDGLRAFTSGSSCLRLQPLLVRAPNHGSSRRSSPPHLLLRAGDTLLCLCRHPLHGVQLGRSPAPLLRRSLQHPLQRCLQAISLAFCSCRGLSGHPQAPTEAPCTRGRADCGICSLPASCFQLLLQSSSVPSEGVAAVLQIPLLLL